MNREKRRNLEKLGASAETIKKLSTYEQPCTILEVVKLARAIAEDVATEYLEDYRQRSANTIIALTLQVELLKKIIIDRGLITEETFQELYEDSAAEFEEKQRQYFNALQEAEAERLQDEEIATEDTTVRGAVSCSEKVHPVEISISRKEVDD